jgi:hypothetical protein
MTRKLYKMQPSLLEFPFAESHHLLAELQRDVESDLRVSRMFRTVRNGSYLDGMLSI